MLIFHPSGSRTIDYGPARNGEPALRHCVVLRIDSDKAPEYEARHREVWPEMREALRKAGWANYSLFLGEDGLVVGYLECDDFERAREAMQGSDVNARWQEEMSGFLAESDGRAPDMAMTPLREVFHLP